VPHSTLTRNQAYATAIQRPFPSHSTRCLEISSNGDNGSGGYTAPHRTYAADSAYHSGSGAGANNGNHPHAHHSNGVGGGANGPSRSAFIHPGMGGSQRRIDFHDVSAATHYGSNGSNGNGSGQSSARLRGAGAQAPPAAAQTSSSGANRKGGMSGQGPVKRNGKGQSVMVKKETNPNIA
jgi:hypothetical protein